MLGLIICTHANLAEALLNSAEMIVGPIEHSAAIGVHAGDPPDAIHAKLSAAIDEVNQGSGALVLCDMFGGTPSNLAISVMEEEKVEVVAGVNLPMLIKISSLRNECEIKELIKVSQESGRKYMNVASAFFGESDNCKKKN